MDKEKLFQLFEKLYFAEIERSNSIISRIRVHSTFIFAIGGALAYMAPGWDIQSIPSFSPSLIFSHASWGWTLSEFSVASSLIFPSVARLGWMALYFLAGFNFICALWILLGAWTGFTHEFISSPTELDEHRTKHKKKLFKKTSAKKEMKETIYDLYRDITTHNMKVNDEKFKALKKSAGYIKSAFLYVFFALLIYQAYVKNAGIWQNKTHNKIEKGEVMPDKKKKDNDRPQPRKVTEARGSFKVKTPPVQKKPKK